MTSLLMLAAIIIDIIMGYPPATSEELIRGTVHRPPPAKNPAKTDSANPADTVTPTAVAVA